MRRRLTLPRARVWEGPLVLVNPSHPIRQEGLLELVPADPCWPGVLLERRTAWLLQACIQSIRGRGAIVPVSGWRSRQEQQAIWDDTTRQEGEDFTRKYVALPGCSEHQTGLAIDLGAAAEHIGSLVGVDEVIAEVLPEEKAGVVERLQSQGRKVMMVGDGINDAPALTAATVGCAIGSGSDIAIESADIVLMRSDLQDVPRAIRLSRLTLRDIKQNLFWAFCYNTIGIPIAAGLLFAFGGPLLSPMFAGAAMSLSSVCVVGNALRLGRAKL